MGPMVMVRPACWLCTVVYPGGNNGGVEVGDGGLLAALFIHHRQFSCRSDPSLRRNGDEKEVGRRREGRRPISQHPVFASSPSLTSSFCDINCPLQRAVHFHCVTGEVTGGATPCSRVCIWEE